MKYLKKLGLAVLAVWIVEDFQHDYRYEVVADEKLVKVWITI